MNLFKKGDVNFLDNVRNHAVWSIIFAVLGIGLGVCCILFFLQVNAIFVWIVIGGITVLSVMTIIGYFMPKTFGRDTGSFILAILALICVIILIVVAATTKSVVIDGVEYSGFARVTVGLFYFFTIFFGIFALCTAIFNLCSIGDVEKGQRGFAIFSDIVSIILGILMIVFPIVMRSIATVFAGIYIIIVCISVIVVAIKALVTAKKIKKAE